MDMNYTCVQFMNTLIFIAQQTMYPSDYVKTKRKMHTKVTEMFRNL